MADEIMPHNRYERLIDLWRGGAMAIRAKTGVPIPPAVARVTPKPKGKAAPAPKTAQNLIDLGLPLINQEQFNWCWAACTAMVASKLKGVWLNQDDLANALLNRNDCSRFNPACDQPATVQQMVSVYSQVGVNCTPSGITSGQRSANLAALLRYLGKQLPVEIGWDFFGRGRHVVVVAGYTQQFGTDWFWVLDPDPSRSDGYWLTYDSLYSADGRGSWIVALTF
jgi:Papain-like cysteine protease AvrRpt2